MRKRIAGIMVSLLVCAVIAGLAPQAIAPSYADEPKPSATVTVIPKAEDLDYKGVEQELVGAGEASGGTMQYALGDQEGAPGDGWDTEIPKGEFAGRYFIWYKAAGDDDHSDSEPNYVSVKIERAKLIIIANDQTYITRGKNQCQGPGDAVYDDPSQIAQMVTVIGLQGDDYIANVIVDGQGDIPGVYPLVPSSAAVCENGSRSDNYEREYIDGKLTILPISLNITVTGSRTIKPYNGKEQKYRGTVTATSSDEAFDASRFHYTGNTVVKGKKVGKHVKKLSQKYCTYDDEYGLYKIKYKLAKPIRLTIKSPVSGILLTTMTAKGSNSLVLTWSKVKGARGYDIFFAECGNTSFKKVKTIKGNKTFKWTKHGLKRGKSYRAYIKTWVKKNGKKEYVKTSPTVHAYASGGYGKYTNAKSVTVEKTRVSLKRGKTYKIKAQVNKLDESKELMPSDHGPSLRYVSSKKNVATVSASGKIKAKGKGSCKVYVFAANGASKVIKVTVK